MGLEDSETDSNFMKADSKLNSSMINMICTFGILGK